MELQHDRRRVDWAHYSYWLALITGWVAWCVWLATYAGYTLLIAAPVGQFVYCVAEEDGSPIAAEVSFSFFPFGPKCTLSDGVVTGPYPVWSIWLIAGIVGGVALLLATESVGARKQSVDS